MRLYKKSERSSFSYWFAHWKSFNLVAMLLGVWEFRFLFHDIEKPFLMFLWKDYSRVQKYHRTHARHHWAYEGDKGYDYLGMVIDWECSRFSKAEARMNAWETALWDYEHEPKHQKEIDEYVIPLIKKLNLDHIRNSKIDLNSKEKP